MYKLFIGNIRSLSTKTECNKYLNIICICTVDILIKRLKPGKKHRNTKILGESFEFL